MQNNKITTPIFGLLTVPMEMLGQSDICEGDLLQFTAEKGRIVITAVTDTSDYVCDRDCESCPVDLCEERGRGDHGSLVSNSR